MLIVISAAVFRQKCFTGTKKEVEHRIMRFLKMLGIVAEAGKDVLKYLTIAVANVYGCHIFGIGHDKCEITKCVSINFLIKITSV